MDALLIGLMMAGSTFAGAATVSILVANGDDPVIEQAVARSVWRPLTAVALSAYVVALILAVVS